MHTKIKAYAFLGGACTAFLGSLLCVCFAFWGGDFLNFYTTFSFFVFIGVIQYVFFLFFLRKICEHPLPEPSTKSKKEFLDTQAYRRNFLGDISHEVKTPLFTVQSYILTLLEEDNPDPIIYKKYLQRAYFGTERLESIFKNLDLIYKLESHHLDLKPVVFDITALIQKVFDLVEISAIKKNIALKFEKFYEFPKYVFADKERIEDVLTNLITNAIKYGKRGGNVIVGICDEGAEKNCITVSDDGMGIAQKHVSRIFERFYRVEKSRSRDAGGSGLGLSIVKHILESHGESISVKSQKNKGTRFFFLPAPNKKTAFIKNGLLCNK